ncbi:zinc-binding dehydrogenase [Agrococcus jenensis]|uniref:enoyl-[acyl-carrier-protein] reductase n=1 Tax=Agrococcus jenensis TaxID=46353 RepID=A0A3N2AUC4_9MICO|nr:zinc-binding dehydrogenase [Agrococcus jenensis]ROR66627.1 NADPH:quinone reductase-like Zn-dependent oxidoreductase [Agrococcus jenensis]
MRAIVHEQFGEPEDVLHVLDRPTPEPGPGQVRVRTTLATIHNHDLWTVRGTYGFKPELPAASGTEAVGVVEAVGEGVEALAVGDRVIAGGIFGVWAEQFVADAVALMPAPAGLPDQAAAQLVAMPFSAISLLEALSLEPGQWIVQNAANGAVGRMVAQLARARGVRVVGLVRRPEGVDELRDAGIDDVVATSEDGWADRIRAITGGAPIVAGVDSVGGSSAGDVLSVLAEGGTLVAFGAMGSPTLELSSGDLIFKQATVRGFWGSMVSRQMAPALKQRLFAELSERIGTGELTLPVSSVHGFDDVRGAVLASLTPGRVGKVLLRP